MNHEYTCNDYREEMILLGLKKRLASPDITEKEKQELIEKIREFEKSIGLD